MTVSARCNAAFSAGEVLALGPIGKVSELVVGPAQAPGEDGVAGQAIRGLVHLAGADDDQLLELGGNRAGVQHRAEMGLHGGKDFGPVSHDAEHVGHVAALGKCLVVECRYFGGDFAAIEPGNPGHWASLRSASIVSPGIDHFGTPLPPLSLKEELAKWPDGSANWPGIILT